MLLSWLPTLFLQQWPSSKTVSSEFVSNKVIDVCWFYAVALILILLWAKAK